MKKFVLSLLMAVVALGMSAKTEDITARFANGYTWNGAESFTHNDDGSITFNAAKWGGLATWYGNANLSEWDKIVFEFAEETTVSTQIAVQFAEEGKEDISAWGNVGITSLELSFVDKDVTDVKQIALQAADVTTLVITSVYLYVEDSDEPEPVDNTPQALYFTAGWRTTMDTSVEMTGNVIFNYTNSYAAVNLISESFNVADYPSYELVLSDDTPTESLQFCVNGNHWGGSFGAGVKNPWPFLPEGVETIESIQLQACNVANLGKVEIVSFYLIDNEGNKVPTVYQTPPSWAATVSIPSGQFSFVEGQYGTVSIVGAAGLSKQTFTLTAAEPFPENLQMKFVTNVGEYYSGLPVGETTFSRDIALEEGETITEIGVLYSSDDTSVLPLTVNFLSATVLAIPSEEESKVGDVNGDGDVDISDVTALVNMILDKSEKTEAADVNGDSTVDISDVTTLVNLILGK